MLAELRNIRKSYTVPGAPAVQEARPGSTPVLRDLNLLIGERESLAITGPSGSGKSTLLNILGTLDRPDAGEVILDGINAALLGEDALSEIRNRFIGFVFQLHHLLPQLTLIENVLLPVLGRRDKKIMKAAGDRGMELLGRVGLEAYADRFPWQLSVGECQRAAVARALINRPRLLLADEPTGSLDADNAAALGDWLSALHRDGETSVVVVTHSADLAGKMEKRYRLGAGILNPVS